MLYDLCQYNQPEISNNDREIKQVLTKLIALSTGDLIEIAGEDVDDFYNDEEIEQLIDTSEEIIEDWLDEVFDRRARLTRPEFIDFVSRQG